MMDYETFKEYLGKYREFQDKIDKLNEAMKGLSPDFGGFSLSEYDQLILDVIKTSMDDVNDWISYYIYELNWGKSYKKGCIKDADGGEIQLKTTRDLYNLLTIHK